MKENKIRILFVEDLVSDYELALHYLKKEVVNFETMRVDTEEDFLQALKDFNPELIVSDYSMPKFDGKKALELCKEFDPELPLIVLTGSMNEETAVECLKAGAADYVIKEHIKRFPFSVLETLEQAKIHKEKIAANAKILEEKAKLASIFRSAPVGVGLVSNRVMLDVNEAFCDMLGYNKEELINKDARMLYPSDKEYEYVGREKYRQIKEKGVGSVEVRMLKKNGEPIEVLLSSSPIILENYDHTITFSAMDITERKNNEWALKESEEKFRLLVTQMQLGLAVHKIILNDKGEPIDYRFIDVNPSFEKMTGLKKSDVVGKTVLEVLPNTEHYWIEKFGKVALTGESLKYENYSQELGKHFKVVAFQPRHKEFAVVIEDVTDKIKAELALKESELHFRTLANSGQALIWTSGTDKKCDYFNLPWLRFTGRKFEQELGDGWTEGIHPSDFDYCLRTYVSSFDKREPFNMIYRMLRHDGRYRWIQDNGSPRYDLDGRFIGYIGHCLDITEQIDTQEALRKRAAIDSALAELSKELLKNDSSLETVIPLVINQAIDLTGSKHGFVSSLDVKSGRHDIIIPAKTESGAKHFSDLKKMTKKGKQGEYEGLLGQALNSRKPFFTNNPDKHPSAKNPPDWHIKISNFLSVPILVDEEIVGQIAIANADYDYSKEDVKIVKRIANYYGLFLKDKKITEAWRLSEEKLVQSQKMEAIGRLAGGVAHDYNNMLQTILGYTEILLAKTGSSELIPQEQLTKYLKEIQKAGNQSAELTKQLLAFARKQTIKPELVDISETITELLKMLHRLIGENISLAWKPGDAASFVLIDPTQLYQIMMNLVINARDAIYDKGTISIETDIVQLNEVFCKMYEFSEPGDYVKLTVADTGCGITDSEIGKIFEPFYTNKEKGKGTGLGLATVYGIVQQNRGIITVRSEPNVGTVFSIYFPVPKEQVDAISTGRLHDPGSSGSGTVLVVEDEEMLLDFIANILEQRGYTVLKASLPSQALAITETLTGRIDLLMTDVVMPEMNGKQLNEKLLKLFPDMKSIYMSGYTANVVSHHGIIDEGINFIQKPFSSYVLLKTIADVMSEEK